MKIVRLILFLVLAAGLAACSTQSATPTENAPTVDSQSGTAYPAGYVAPTVNYTLPVPTGYPAPDVTQTDTTVNKLLDQTPDPTKATVSGKLLIKGLPAVKYALYLARVLKDASGKEITLSLDKQSSPYAITDSQGQFVFKNVPMDTYGLILDNGNVSMALNKPDSSKDQLRIIVESPQAIDIGTLSYTDLGGN